MVSSFPTHFSVLDSRLESHCQSHAALRNDSQYSVDECSSELPFQQENGAHSGRARALLPSARWVFMALFPALQSCGWKMRWHHKTEQQDGIWRSQTHWAQHSCQLEHSWKLYHNLALVKKNPKNQNKNPNKTQSWLLGSKMKFQKDCADCLT